MVARPASAAQSSAAPALDDPHASCLSAAVIHRDADRDARRTVRVAQFIRVKTLADAGLSLNDIMRETGFNWCSVSKWSDMADLAPRQRVSACRGTRSKRHLPCAALSHRLGT
jgi:hypothetical protein